MLASSPQDDGLVLALCTPQGAQTVILGETPDHPSDSENAGPLCAFMLAHGVAVLAEPKPTVHAAIFAATRYEIHRDQTVPERPEAPVRARDPPVVA